MKAQRLPVRRQRARLMQTISGVLKAGLTGWIMPNETEKPGIVKGNVPDYLFRPDVNPELSFLVFAEEIVLLPDASEQAG
jgi:hypothetical protein